MKPPLSTAGDIRRHVELKLALGELREPVVQRLLEALDRGDDPVYTALLEAATFPPPPPVVYHTASTGIREQVLRAGLEARQPGPAGNWPQAIHWLEEKQPPGVYVAAEPDRIGVFAHWESWDVWEVRLGDLPWQHDRVNPGCWSLDKNVPAGQVRLAGTYTNRKDNR